MFVPTAFVKNLQDESAFIVSKGRGGDILRGLPEEDRKMLSVNKLALGKDNRVANGILQLADIAGPAIVHQRLHGTWREGKDFLSFLEVILL